MLKTARATHHLLAWAWLAGGCALAQAQSYECQLAPQGPWQAVSQNLAERFPAALAGCRLRAEPPEEASLTSLSPLPPPQQAPAAREAGVILRVITARSSPWLQPAPEPALQGPGDWDGLIVDSAARHAVDPRLVQAVIQVESAFVPAARSPKGAIGLMQLMPATAERFGAPSAESLWDPQVNVEVGVRYLRSLLDRFGERTDLALAAYNAGEGAVVRYGYQVPPYRETQDYVRKVRRLYQGFD